MSIRRLLALALLAGAPKIASAQFTTFIPPRNTVADSVKAVVVAQQKVEADSVAHAQLTNMKTWVDSAAGLTPIPVTAADSLAQGVTTSPAAPAEFPNGMRAPSTASSLPLMLLAGLALLVAGLALMRRPEPGRVPVRTRPRA